MFVSPKFTPDDITRQECLREVSRCGQFEGCHTATPYLWNRVMQWGESPDYDCYDQLGWLIGEMNEDEFEDLPLVFRYKVDIQDIANFPELNGIACVFMWQDDNGFIYDNPIESPERSILRYEGITWALLDRLNVALDYDLAIHGLGPNPVDHLSRDQMIERRDIRISSAIRYLSKNQPIS